MRGEGEDPMRSGDLGNDDPGGPGERQDDLFVEVTDLRTSLPPVIRSRLRPRGVLAATISARFQSLLTIAVTALVTLVIALALPLEPGRARAPAPAPTPTPRVASNSQLIVGLASGTPAETPYPTPTVVAPPIGVAPEDCPLASEPVPFDPQAVGSGIGGSEVWLVAPFSGSPAALHLNWLLPSGYTQYGWPVPVQVLVKVGFSQQITLSGSDLRTRYPLWLAASPYTPAEPVTTLDPAQLPSSTSDRAWSIWFGILYLPGAGCYMWRASWLGGGWTAGFAAGE